MLDIPLHLPGDLKKIVRVEVSFINDVAFRSPHGGEDAIFSSDESL